MTVRAPMFAARGCSLCATPAERIPPDRLLVAGADGGICEDCILLCAEVLAARRQIEAPS